MIYSGHTHCCRTFVWGAGYLRGRVLFVLLLAFSFLYEACASDELPMSAFSRIPILHEGRVKPLDSVARSFLLQFSGRTSLEDEKAIRWLARAVFDPRAASRDRIFLVDDPKVMQALGIKAVSRGRHSYSVLVDSFETLGDLVSRAEGIPVSERRSVDRQILLLSDKIELYLQVRPALAASVHDVSGWLSMQDAYSAGDGEKFGNAAEAYLAGANSELSPGMPARIRAEVILNRFDPFLTVKVIFAFVFLLAIPGCTGGRRRRLDSVASWLHLAAFLLLSTAIGMRMWIMGRPPVTNLYSTFVFTAWMLSLLGLVVTVRGRKQLGNLCSGIGGFVFLMIAGRYSATGDTMGVMVAVLNSNFWLASHVVTIMMGYAGCCFAGIVGHVYLLQAAFKPDGKDLRRETARILRAVLGFGLTWTFIGTVLGGVWADKSWGRFWGWDPKENGALLIILWCSILFHAARARMIGRRGLAIGAVLGIQVVLLAWFGVNLLGVGLHSYGQDSSSLTAYCLAGFFFAEILFLMFVRFWGTDRGATRTDDQSSSVRAS